LTKKQHLDAIRVFKECLEFGVTPGKLAWQYVYSYLFTAHILNKNYAEAYKHLAIVMGHPKFIQVYQNYREPWYIKEAFIAFLVKKNKVEIDKSNLPKLRNFKLSRFLNELPQFSKDKRGLNITINIIHVLFLLIEEKYDQALDKFTALKQYSFRYLKKPEYIRQRNFIKMMLKIPAGNYQASLIRKKTQKYYEVLLANPMDFSEQAMNVEVIPYEILWEEILDIFTKKGRQ